MSHPVNEPAVATSSEVGRRCLILSLLTAAVVYAADQLTKWWVVTSLPLGQQFPVVPGLLWWQHIRNSGAAFSLGSDVTWIFTIVMTVVVTFIAVTLPKVRHPAWAVALGLVLAGAGGNLTDRLLRAPGFAQGHVVDFIAVPKFAIFNVADCAVVTGIGLILILLMRGRDMTDPPRSGGIHRGTHEETEHHAPAGSAAPAGTRPSLQHD